MYCPKCGTSNSHKGKYCRKCGIVLDGLAKAMNSGSCAMTESSERDETSHNLESAMKSLFGGVAFLTIAIILAVTGITGGRYWWFWLLIPAFGGIGVGIAKFFQLWQSRKGKILVDPDELRGEPHTSSTKSLYPDQTEYVSNIPNQKHKTRDLAPPSVVENTTRHLEMDPDGETMTLPEDKIS